MVDSNHDDTLDHYIDFLFKLKNHNILCLYEFFCVFVSILPRTLPVPVSCPVGLVTEMIFSSTAAIPDIILMYNLISFEWRLSDSLDYPLSIIN